jgi:hypothetical protein
MSVECPQQRSLRWVEKNSIMRITKHCKFKISINAGFVDEVESDIVPLDPCEVMLLSPCLWDRDALFPQKKISITWPKAIKHTLSRHTKRDKTPFALAS